MNGNPCGIDSIFDFTEHIKFRIGYIKGVGQLCLDCLHEIYFKKNTSYLKQMYASYFDFLFLLMTIPTLKRIQ